MSERLFTVGAAPLPAIEDEATAANDLMVGTAAEHLVCADLLLAGYRAFLADQTCPYDVAVDVGRLVRVQVKSTREPRALPQRVNHSRCYLWHTKRAGKGGRRRYVGHEFDLLALVATDIRRIAYMPPGYKANVVVIRVPGDPAIVPGRAGKQFDDFLFDRALAQLEGR